MSVDTVTIKNRYTVYFKTNPGYEFVKDQIGFYAGTRGATIEE